MLINDVTLTHEQQQEAVELIQKLMSEGISSGQAIAYVAQQIREQHKDQVDKNNAK